MQLLVEYDNKDLIEMFLGGGDIDLVIEVVDNICYRLRFKDQLQRWGS